jgi:hypothetical protein
MASEATGGLNNYYLVRVEYPQRPDQQPYTAEFEDIAEALQFTPDEFNAAKAIWRSAAARLDNVKPGHKALYDAEKVVHSGSRMVRRLRRAAEKEGRGAMNRPMQEDDRRP